MRLDETLIEAPVQVSPELPGAQTRGILEACVYLDYGEIYAAWAGNVWWDGNQHLGHTAVYDVERTGPGPWTQAPGSSQQEMQTPEFV
jgi:hypothetical protein